MSDSRLFDLSVLTKKDLDGAGMIVITMPESRDGHTDFHLLRDLVPPGCIVAFVRPGESIAALSEDQMREMGWVRADKAVPNQQNPERKESP